jgi:SAM-dependent methyltransferase
MMRFPFKRTMTIWLRNRTFRFEGWHFSDYRRSMIIRTLDDWNRNYLPIDVRGLTVLDVGAGEGETAWFFLKHGAKRVFAIECDEKCRENLMLNARSHAVTPIFEKFNLGHLTLPFDFMKMDIEGYEEQLLNTNVNCPCVIEVHGLQLKERFQRQGYKIVSSTNPNWLCYAFKNIRKVI